MFGVLSYFVRSGFCLSTFMATLLSYPFAVLLFLGVQGCDPQPQQCEINQADTEDLYNEQDSTEKPGDDDYNDNDSSEVWDEEAETDEEIPPEERLEKDLWPWGAKAAVSLTLDEGVAEPFLILAPEVESRGWRMTFFVYTDQAEDEQTWNIIFRAHLNGHEISNHTKTHPNMVLLDEKTLRIELESGIFELQNHLGWDLPLQSFAYPYESWNGFVWSIVSEYHRYARSGDGGVPVPPNPVPLNHARWPEWGHLIAKAPTKEVTVESWNSWIDAAVKEEKWLIEELHGVKDGDVVGGWEPRTLEEFQEHFDYIESFGRKVWVAPMRIVGHYIDEREGSELTFVEWSEERVVIEHKDNFFQPWFNIPITYTLKIPESWEWDYITVLQGPDTMAWEKLEPGLFRISSVPDGNLLVEITPR